MTVEIRALPAKPDSKGGIVVMTISGKIDVRDYEKAIPELEQQIEQHGKLSLLVELMDFHGWTLGAAWEDTKFGIRHFSDFERLAVVGDKQWEKGMITFAKPFTAAELRYFDQSEKDMAEQWIERR